MENAKLYFTIILLFFIHLSSNEYEIENLGTLSLSEEFSPWQINNKGQVLGQKYSDYFFWDPNDGMFIINYECDGFYHSGPLLNNKGDLFGTYRKAGSNKIEGVYKWTYLNGIQRYPNDICLPNNFHLHDCNTDGVIVGGNFIWKDGKFFKIDEFSDIFYKINDKGFDIHDIYLRQTNDNSTILGCFKESKYNQYLDKKVPGNYHYFLYDGKIEILNIDPESVSGGILLLENDSLIALIEHGKGIQSKRCIFRWCREDDWVQLDTGNINLYSLLGAKDCGEFIVRDTNQQAWMWKHDVLYKVTELLPQAFESYSNDHGFEDYHIEGTGRNIMNIHGQCIGYGKIWGNYHPFIATPLEK